MRSHFPTLLVDPARVDPERLAVGVDLLSLIGIPVVVDSRVTSSLDQCLRCERRLELPTGPPGVEYLAVCRPCGLAYLVRDLEP